MNYEALRKAADMLEWAVPFADVTEVPEAARLGAILRATADVLEKREAK